MGVIDRVPFEPLTAGIKNYTVSATIGAFDICLGDSVIFSGAGVETYNWCLGVVITQFRIRRTI